VFQLVKALSRHAEVRVVAFGEGAPMPLRHVSVRSVQMTIAGRLSANLRAPRPTLPGQVRLFLDADMRSMVSEQIESWRPDVLHVTLARMAPYMPAPGPFHRHLDFTDSLALNMATRARAHRGPARLAFELEARLMRAYETEMAAAADSCSVVSKVDRDMAGLSGAAVIPNGVDPEAFPFAEPVKREPVMIFFGNLGYFHNVEPARFLAQRVLPLVRDRVPGAVLRLVGARPAAAVRRLASLDGVQLVPNAPEMAPELHRAAVAVVPSFSGSGIKNKVLESFSAGLPLVTNRLGIHGIEGAVAGEHFLLAEEPGAMATAAADLLLDTDVRSRLASAAHALILESFTWSQQADALVALYGLELS
jgi:glycosyltransferase involved in cell wall biosynthesis